ncbi:MAG TPA: cytochrome C oxidase subunit IV family protein, partial [Candidatus Poseidoniia archaeon]|nr:cytochrome C oxidase subunit IV family protein [Candidatus Poseidoniia archaeon]
MEGDHKKTYIINAVLLAILTVVELGIIELPIPKSAQVVLLLAFAVTKIMLVALVYMHLRYETKFLRRLLLVPIPLALFLAWGVIYDLP